MNDNQNTVLSWFKNFEKSTGLCPTNVLSIFLRRRDLGKLHASVENSYDSLTPKEEFEVLAEFAKWGLENA